MLDRSDLDDRRQGSFIPDLIPQVREGRGLSVRDLAAVLDLSIQAVTAWERRLSAPSPQHLNRVARALGVSIDDLTSTPVEQANLISLRFRVGLSATEVASRLSIHKSALSVIEHGYRRLPRLLVNPLSGLYHRSDDAIISAWEKGRLYVTARATSAASRDVTTKKLPDTSQPDTDIGGYIRI